MSSPGKQYEEKDAGLWRDLVAYWFLGLCNNYGYVVMLSAAHDIIGFYEKLERAEAGKSDEQVADLTANGTHRHCHVMSTGAVLLAGILPALLAKALVPFLPFWPRIINGGAIICAAASFVIVGFASSKTVALFGVVVTSAGMGFGEAIMLAYTCNYHINVVSTWSSGTGGSGIAGSTFYATLREAGLTIRQSMLIMLFFPLIQAVSFFLLLRRPDQVPDMSKTHSATVDSDDVPLEGFKQKFFYIRHILKYMIPLWLVYYFEYIINQGLFELTYFDNCALSFGSQYRWLQVDYQIGVFISRSSVNIHYFSNVWPMTILQGINLVYYLFDAIYFITPYFWMLVALTFWEGLLGGAAYVNTFYKMSKEISPTYRMYAMTIVVLSDSAGIALAGFTAMPIHNAICRMKPIHRTSK